MGQYHILVNRDANEHVKPHTLGSCLKAWEQVAGAVPAALVFLLAVRPGNAPGDVGHHPLAGHWAGERILAIGDYANDDDIADFGQSPPLHILYQLCTEPPDPGEERQAYSATRRTRSGRTIRRTVTAAMQYRQELREFQKITRTHRHVPNIGVALQGPIENALSVRFCPTSSRMFHPVPVDPDYYLSAQTGAPHYQLPSRLLRPQTEGDAEELAMIWRFTGMGGWDRDPRPDPSRLPANRDRWPWDRPPHDMPLCNSPTACDAENGQERVYANLDRKEYFDPRPFGETPTTLGLMRAAAGIAPFVPDILIDHHQIAVQPRIAADAKFSSAACLWAMLLHPQPRGGGDIEPAEFPEIGRWRHNRLLLTSDYQECDGALPTTATVRSSFANITDRVMTSARAARRALGG